MPTNDADDRAEGKDEDDNMNAHTHYDHHKYCPVCI